MDTAFLCAVWQGLSVPCVAAVALTPLVKEEPALPQTQESGSFPVSSFSLDMWRPVPVSGVMQQALAVGEVASQGGLGAFC